ncbi:MAG: hypothetical protein EXR68_06090 [Dehalococcoidia bacterium]|nr:hypothetical protein [Dehalococcoidia bacterium]
MTTKNGVTYRYSELVEGYELPSLHVVPTLINANPGSADHYREMSKGFRGQPIWGPNLWGHSSRIFEEYFGAAWLASGQLNVEFKKPMYPDEALEVTAKVIARTSDAIDFEVSITNGEGIRTAGGNAQFPLLDSVAQPELPKYVVPDDFKNTESWPRGELPVGIPCTPERFVVTEELQRESLETTDELEVGIYKNLVHPRLFLAETFKLKTERPESEPAQAQRRGGIHVGSEAVNYLPAPLGKEYRWYGTYIDAFETSKGDQWGRKEVIVLDDQDRVVFKTINKFIFNPAVYRQPEDKAKQ